MDESFQLRAKRLLGESRAASLDFSVLSAALSAQQAASPAARAQAESAPAAGEDEAAEPIEEILLCGPGWRSAASAQKGCFNRAESKRRRNGA